MNFLGSLIGIAICIILSAFFSAMEMAFSSLNKTRLKSYVEKGNKKAALALKLYENYDKLISTILIGNNIVNIAVASIATILFVQIYGDIGATISTVTVTIVVLIFGEITPKSLVKDCPERFAVFSAPFIQLLIWILTPVNFLFTLWKKLISKVFKIKKEEKMSHEELRIFLDDVEQEGSIDKNEGELLRNVIEFRDLTVAEILTHRLEVDAISIDDEPETIARTFTRSHHSRLPVYRDSIDQIIGILHQKDFYVDGKITDRPLESLLTQPVFVYQHSKIRDLMRCLQSEKSHIAIVIDEFGGTLGIVTMEDILEELVGEIWDEHDEIEEPIQKINENTYRVDGAVTLDDFMDFFNVIIESESISVGGWVMEYLNRMPTENDRFLIANLEIIVSGMIEHRVSSITVKENPQMGNAGLEENELNIRQRHFI